MFVVADRKRWYCVRAKQGKQGPGPLHSHAACKLPGCMLVFGGERAGQPSADLWRFHFGTETWDRVSVDGPKPSARSEATALAVSELLLTAAAASDASAATSPREARSPAGAGQQATLRRARAGGSVDRYGSAGSAGSAGRHALHNRVSPGPAPAKGGKERKYVFRPSAYNYVDGSEDKQDKSRSSESPVSGLGVDGAEIGVVSAWPDACLPARSDPSDLEAAASEAASSPVFGVARDEDGEPPSIRSPGAGVGREFNDPARQWPAICTARDYSA